ncbi:MAG: hypothetical protein ACLTDR_11920 [Adlercreutzia equolifaciens]
MSLLSAVRVGRRGRPGRDAFPGAHRARVRLPGRHRRVPVRHDPGRLLGIVTETGALDAGIAALVHKLKGNELVLIPILMAIFSIGGTTYGMCGDGALLPALLAATPWWPPASTA